VATQDARRLQRRIDGLADRLPPWAARAVRWLTGPDGRWARLPAGLLLVAGGLAGFLPVLGFWMVPLGLLLLAKDIAVLRRPVLWFVSWLQRAWERLEAWWRRRRAG
jgi:hypothetical protein